MTLLDEELLLAALSGNTDRVKEIHQRGGNLGVRNNCYNTLVHIAVLSGNEGLFEYVVNRLPLDEWDTINREGLTPLMIACTKSNTEKMIEELLKRGVHRRRITQDTKYTPLMTLAAAGRNEAIDLFYKYPDKRSYPDLEFPKDKKKGVRVEEVRSQLPILERNHLMAAVLANQKSTVQFILARDTSLLNSIDKNGCTPLVLAARDKKINIEIDKILLQAGADPSIHPTERELRSFIHYEFLKCTKIENGQAQFEEIKKICQPYASVVEEIQYIEANKQKFLPPKRVKSCMEVNKKKALRHKYIRDFFENEYY